jgi:hypothetical protein
LKKVSIEAFADFFLRLFGIYGYALNQAMRPLFSTLTIAKFWNCSIVG